MKKISFLFSFLLVATMSFAQFADTAQLNTFIRDTIKDRRPEKVTASQLQKALLGISNVSSKYADSTGNLFSSPLQNKIDSLAAAAQTQINTKLTNPMTTEGDIVNAGTSGVPQRFAAGAANQIFGMTATGTTQEYKNIITGTGGLDVNIVHTPNNIIVNVPNAGVTGRGVVSTTSQNFSGDKWFSGLTTLGGGFRMSSTPANNNLSVLSIDGAGGWENTTSWQFEGAANTIFRVGMRGSVAAAPAASRNYTNMIMGTQTVTEPTSGNATLYAGLVLKPISVTAGAGTVSNSATLYIEGADNTVVSGANYAQWVKAGKVRIGGELILDLKASAVLDFPLVGQTQSSDLTIALTGAVVGDMVILGVDNASVLGNSCFTAWVSAANTVTVRFNNYNLLDLDPPSGTFKVSIIR